MLLTSILAAAASLFLDQPSSRARPLGDKPSKSEPALPASTDPTDAEEPEGAPGSPIGPDTLAALASYTPIAENVWRVDGPSDALVTRTEQEGVAVYGFDQRMLIDTKLPVGYPQPTPPDVIEIKAYPGVRRAEVSGRGSPDMGMNIAFWPLFQHIDRNAIAMTAPVEIDYRGLEMRELDPSAAPEGWTMAFLYEKESDGPVGEFGRIEVVDREPLLVIAAGVRGTYRYSRMQGAMARIVEWIQANPQWESAGEPRMMGYNGPDRRPADQWSEIQIPIRLVPPAPADEARPTPGTAG